MRVGNHNNLHFNDVYFPQCTNISRLPSVCKVGQVCAKMRARGEQGRTETSTTNAILFFVIFIITEFKLNVLLHKA